jgi:hypothetical protein
VKGHDMKNLEFGGFRKTQFKETVKIVMWMQAPVVLEPERQ